MNMNRRLRGKEVNGTSLGSSPVAGFVVSGIGVLDYGRTLLTNMLAHRICTDTCWTCRSVI